MKSLFLFLVFATAARADFSDDQVPAAPDILARLIEGAEKFGSPLRFRTSEAERTVYYLRSAAYVGECAAPFGKVHIARLFFVRSGVPEQETPPARGHGFLVFYDSDFRVRGIWRAVEGQFSVRGTRLFEGERELFDYARLPAHRAGDGSGEYPRPPVWK